MEPRDRARKEKVITDHDCPFCGTSVQHGYLVCLGCHAEVVYGSTREEMQRDRHGGFILAGGAVLTGAWLFSDMLPIWTRVGVFVMLILTVGLGMYLGYWYAQQQDRQRREEPPRFFRQTSASGQ